MHVHSLYINTSTIAPLKKIATCLLAILLAVQIVSFAASTTKTDSLYTLLHNATSPADSLRILYNIHDLNTKDENKHLNATLYEVAKRAGNTRAQLDILRIIGNDYLGNDSAQTLVLNEAMTLPHSDEQKETVTFLRLLIVSTRALFTDSDEKQKWMLEALDRYSTRTNKTDRLENLEQLYTVCIYLGSTIQSDLLEKYLEESEEMINALPFGLYALRNMYYAHTALIHTTGGQFEKAVNADRHLLTIMDQMEKEYRANGREFKNYNRNRYICYRRMLCNYPALSPEEVEEYFNRINALAEESDEIREDIESTSLPEIYYRMARKEYDKALPALARVTNMDIPGSAALKPRLYKMLIEAAQATGNKDLLLESLIAYTAIQSDYIKSKSAERYRELQIIYDVDRLNRQKNEIATESHKSKIKLQSSIIFISAISFTVLFILCMILLRLYRRAKKLSKGLAESNMNLKKERDVLKRTQNELITARDAANRAAKLKTAFIDNMSCQMQEPISAIAGYTQLIVDSLDDKDRLRLEKYSNLVMLNTELVLTMLYDVLTMSDLNKKKLAIAKSYISVKTLCDVAMNSVASKLQPGVHMVYAKENQEDIEIYTDPQRVQQVLVNLLQNAVKFTMTGQITLDWELDADKSHITFSVTDTGCGIPADKSEIIFDRFEKLNSYKEGVGLGLPISRTVASLLKGEVVLDSGYTGGARFLFTIPCVDSSR